MLVLRVLMNKLINFCKETINNAGIELVAAFMYMYLSKVKSV